MLNWLNKTTPAAIKQRLPAPLKSYLQARVSSTPVADSASTELVPQWPTSDGEPEIPIYPHCPPVTLCSLAGPAAYHHPEWRALHRELAEYSFDHHVFSPNVYRKGWEWTQAAYGLMQLNMLRPEHSALGVGAGRECLIFWLGDRLRQVIATDLYGNAAWTSKNGREADPGVLESPQKYCPKPMDLRAIQFMNMDGTELRFPDNHFDFAWSMSSIEHFGGHDKSAQAVREMARVVRPGGIVAIATEYLLFEEYQHPEFFTKNEIETYVVKASPQLALVEPINFALPPAEYLADSVVVPQGVYKTRRHIVLNDGRVQWTSIMIFLRKKA
jgi:SAM-dependent methyltransferase